MTSTNYKTKFTCTDKIFESKEIKQNWIVPYNFDIFFKEIFDSFE